MTAHSATRGVCFVFVFKNQDPFMLWNRTEDRRLRCVEPEPFPLQSRPGKSNPPRDLGPGPAFVYERYAPCVRVGTCWLLENLEEPEKSPRSGGVLDPCAHGRCARCGPPPFFDERGHPGVLDGTSMWISHVNMGKLTVSRGGAQIDRGSTNCGWLARLVSTVDSPV